MRPLYSYQSEQSVLGALLLQNTAFDNIGDLRDSDFYAPEHRAIFCSVAKIIGSGKRADVVTVTADLERGGALQGIGGVEYIGELLQAVPTAATIKQYAKTVVERRIERDLAIVAEKLTELASGSGEVNERLAEAQKLVFDLAEVSGEEDGVEIRAAAAGFLDTLEQRFNAGTHITGFATDLTDLDEKLCGLQRGDLIIVAGRPSMGKTSVAMQFAIRGALRGEVVQVYSMEMSRAQLVERAVANIGRVNSHTLRTGQLQGEDWERVSLAIGRINEMPMIIDDTPALPVARMLARSRRLRRKHGRLDLIVIDYLQLMDGAGDNRNEQISTITRGLKQMARELNVPVVLLSQLSRKCEERTDKRPLMSDLRDSGSIEQDADVIIFVYRDEVYNKESKDAGICELLIRKQRMGETGDVMTVWMGEYSAIGDSEWKRSAVTPKPNRRDGEFYA